MAYLNISGAETGDFSEASATSGTVSVQTTTKRTGAYAYRINPTAATAYIEFQKHGANAKTAALGASVWVTVYIRFASFPSSTERVLGIYNATALSNATVEVLVTSGGAVTLRGTTTSGTIATLSTDTWYRFDLRGASAGTCGLAIDGGSETTVTGNTQTPNIVALGIFSATMDAFYDDLAIKDDAFAGAGQVNVMTVDGNGSVPGSWTDTPNNGAGLEYQSLDEIPHDSGTSYVATYNNANEVAYFTCISAATAGVAGTIGTVKTIGILAETTSLSTSGYIRTRSGTTNSDSTAVDVGNTSYVTFAKLNDTNPADSAAWESADLDGLNIGFGQGPDTSQIRCTLLCAMVWCSGGVAVTGTATLSLPNVTLAGSGKQTHSGTSILTLNNVALAASGTHKQTGSSVLSLPNVTMIASGTQGLVGTSVLLLNNIALAATGFNVPTGAAVLTLNNVSLAGSGIQSHIGAAILILPNVALAATGKFGYQGQSVLTLPNVALAGSGTQTYSGTSILTLPNVALLGSGVQTHTGTGSLILPNVTLAAAGIMLVNHGPLYVHSELVLDFSVLVSELDFPNLVFGLEFPYNNLNLDFPYLILSHKFPRQNRGY